ncbi:hypothetical protein PRK78_001704 [Emydomyces testavorans]|uniref:MINDY deubiquitinase domain-containing protein n=1 Tax=Emydomyces testavorans TaxID=2070801 RepID=A0AAF0IGX5_9EURO|nr:hypothetical protein PRK78_001704 [Emydomyces testavorans]
MTQLERPEGDSRDNQDRLRGSVESESHSVSVLEMTANRAAPSQRLTAGLKSAAGDSQIPRPEAIGEPQSHIQPDRPEARCASSQPELIDINGQVFAQPETGITSPPDQHLQIQTDAEVIDPFMSTETDVSSRKAIELQSNNPFKAKVERGYNGVTSDPSPEAFTSRDTSVQLDGSVSPFFPGRTDVGLAIRSLPAAPTDFPDTIASESADQTKLETENNGQFEARCSGADNYRSNDHQILPSDVHSDSLPPAQGFIQSKQILHEDPHTAILHHAPSFHDSQLNNQLVEPDQQASLSKASRSVQRSEEQPARSQEGTNEGQRPQSQEKPSEIYGIRVINWSDGIHKTLRQSPVLIQNENGPCPLLALVNSLVMRTPPDFQSPLIRALRSRERISLGLLIQSLFDELTTYGNEDCQLPDIEDLSKFLTMLHTGMNVNPRLTPNMDPAQPGMFHQTRDVKLYSAFNLPLVHGWLASPSSEAHDAMIRVAEYHDDIQLLHFRKEELEERVISGGTISAEEEQLVRDIDSIQRFVNMENPTQLSPFGLEHLGRSVKPGAICILFRNDHFSTLFKHPQSHQLFTLVTDAGYATHAEVVWESLVNVNGSGSELFSGDFRPVGNEPSSPLAQQHRGQLAAERTQNQNNEDGQQSTHNEQTDADYAYALALQFQDEEEERARAETRSHRPQSQSSWQTPSHKRHARSASNSIPETHQQQPSTGLRQPCQSQVIRPLVPPAPATPIRQSLSADANAPPPSYEQAARTPPYNPEDHHSPHFDGTNSIAGTRSSSYNYGASRTPPRNMNHRPGRRREPTPITTATLDRSREKDKNKDCIVM